MALLGAVADVGTTAYGISSGRAQEANPLYGSDQTAIVTSLAVAATIHLLMRWWLEGKPEQTQLRAWSGVSAIRFGVAGWNLSQLGK